MYGGETMSLEDKNKFDCQNKLSCHAIEQF